MPEFDKSSKKQTPFARFVLEILGPDEDVDREALEEAGGWQGRTLRHTLYLTEDAAWRAKEFCDHCGVDPDGTLGQRLEGCNGCQVLIEVRHEASQSGDGVFANIARTAAIG